MCVCAHIPVCMHMLVTVNFDVSLCVYVCARVTVLWCVCVPVNICFTVVCVCLMQSGACHILI